MKWPHNPDAERNVLGAMLAAPRAILQAQDAGLQPEHFWAGSHEHVCRAIYQIDEAGEPADPITVARRLEEKGLLEAVGGRALVNTLVSEVASVTNAEQYARIIIDVAAERRIGMASTKLAELSQGAGTAAEKMALAESIIAETISAASSADDFELIGKSTLVAYQEIEAAVREGKPRQGLKTGFSRLDTLTNGFEAGQLVIVAARPGFGKSTFAQNIAEWVAIKGSKVAIFSLEMAAEEIGKRMLSSLSKVKHDKIRQASLTPAELSSVREAAERLNTLPIYTIDGTVNLTELRARTRRMKRTEGLDLLIVDYLQLVDPGIKTESQQVKIATISRALKLLAMELRVPVLALSQLSRGVDHRDNKRPRLADLRDSGAIEQDADVVLFIYRDDQYDADSEAKGEAEVIVAKQRSGATGKVKLAFLTERCKFSNPGAGGEMPDGADTIPF